MQTLKKHPQGRSSLAKRSGFWGQKLRKFHPKPSQSDLGRFISADPIGFAGGLNLYNYGNQNPITAADPSGLVKIRIGSWEFEIHLTDADPHPSAPHAHIRQAPSKYKDWTDPRTKTKLDLISGEFKQGPEVVGDLAKIKGLRGAKGAFAEGMGGSSCMIKRLNAGKYDYHGLLSGMGGKVIRGAGFVFFAGAAFMDLSRVASAAPDERLGAAGEVGGGWALGAAFAKFAPPPMKAAALYMSIMPYAIENSPDRGSYNPADLTSSGWPY